LEARHVGHEWLEDDGPLINADRAALGEAVLHWEASRESSINAHAGSTSGFKDAAPTDDSGNFKAHVLHGAKEPLSVDSVIGFDLVCRHEETRETQLTEAGAQSHLIPYFIRDVTVAEKGCLHDVDEVVEGPL
jgi:hypothetical protein